MAREKPGCVQESRRRSADSLVRVFPKILTNHRADMAVPLLLERALGKNGKNEPTKLWIDPGLALWTMSHHCMRITCPVWCLRNSYTFVALKLAWGEARGRECIRSDTRPTEQRSPRPISEQPEGDMSLGRRRRCSLLTDSLRDMLWCPCGSTSRLASAQNPWPRMYSYFGDTTLASIRTAVVRPVMAAAPVGPMHSFPRA